MEPLKLEFFDNKAPFQASATFAENTNSLDFGETLSTAMDNLKALHVKSNSLIQSYASGQSSDLTEVMMSIEKTTMATELAMQIRNKLFEGYQEIMRLQI